MVLGEIDWIDKIRISCCSYDDGKKENRRETRNDDNRNPVNQVM